MQKFVTSCAISDILAQVDHKDTNWSFITLLMTFNKLIQYHSARIILMHNHK